jgi:two-component system sensor histidine kinase RegB
MPQTIDLPQLTQAITALLNNANDASNQSATLTLSWNQEHVMLCVTNQGNGFPNALLASFPKPQLSNKVDGHGMGLMLAHTSIARLGGNLTLTNPENGGAQACITLPADLNYWKI